MSREIKIGLLTFVVLTAMIWGYTFLKGRNLLSTDNELRATYTDVGGLNVSSPVLVNGYKIGTVTKIKLNENDVKKMDVFFLVDGDYKIPKTAIAELRSAGLMDGKAIFLTFDKACTGPDCVVSGDELNTTSVGLLGSMVSEGELDGYTMKVSESAKAIIGNIGKPGEPGSLNSSIRQIDQITQNLAVLTQNINTLLSRSNKGIEASVNNIATLTSSLAKSNQKIEGMLANFDKISSDISKANLGNTITTANSTLETSKASIAELKTTLVSATKTMDQLSTTLDVMQKGDGSVAKLMNDKQLYTNLEATTKNLELLLQDLRLNPKRYAHFSLFGKKQKQYTLPQDDPAYEQNDKK
jgi:phospholipid/cholesterol/gamma-HCH transport system substrate-binding protein